MEKIIVSKGMSDALDNALALFGTAGVLRNHCDVNSQWSYERKCLNTLSVEEMAKILVLGYEIEMTPEEEVIEFLTIRIPTKK